MKNPKYVVLSLLIILFFSSVNFAQMRNDGKRGDMREMIKKKLQLTADQEKKISEPRLNHQERIIDLTSQLKKKELEKEKILSGDAVQRDDMLRVTKEMQEVKNKIEAEKINHQMDIYEILDANQKQIWKDMQLRADKMKMHMRKGMKDRMQNRTKDRDNNQK
jgi:hypothetical protein